MSTICIIKNILKNKAKQNMHMISEDEIFECLHMHARVNDMMAGWRFTVLKLCGQTN